MSFLGDCIHSGLLLRTITLVRVLVWTKTLTKDSTQTQRGQSTQEQLKPLMSYSLCTLARLHFVSFEKLYGSGASSIFIRLVLAQVVCIAPSANIPTNTERSSEPLSLSSLAMSYRAVVSSPRPLAVNQMERRRTNERNCKHYFYRISGTADPVQWFWHDDWMPFNILLEDHLSSFSLCWVYW